MCGIEFQDLMAPSLHALGLREAHLTESANAASPLTTAELLNEPQSRDLSRFLSTQTKPSEKLAAKSSYEHGHGLRLAQVSQSFPSANC